MFTARLVNSPEQDPALLLDVAGFPGAYLIDCGTLTGLHVHDVIRVRRLFVTHTHIDHWCGFDHLIRMQLFSPAPLEIYGPPGLGAQVAARLAGYSWNLISGSRYVIWVHELGGVSTRLPCNTGFAPEPADAGSLQFPEGPRLHYAPVEHGVPCLAYALRWPERQTVDREALAACGLAPGAWLEELKRRREGTLTVEDRELDVGEWRARLLRSRPGASLAYVTDTLCSPTVHARVMELAAGVDELWCEAAYLEEHAEKARKNLHMTAAQAAGLARDAGVRRLHLFHQSRRYTEGVEAHLEEARAVFPETSPPPRY